VDGLNVEGENVEGLNVDGLKVEGENVDGLNTDGENVEGLNVDGLYASGLNVEGLKVDGEKVEGLNVDGANSAGELQEIRRSCGGGIELARERLADVLECREVVVGRKSRQTDVDPLARRYGELVPASFPRRIDQILHGRRVARELERLRPRIVVARAHLAQRRRVAAGRLQRDERARAHAGHVHAEVAVAVGPHRHRRGGRTGDERAGHAGGGGGDLQCHVLVRGPVHAADQVGPGSAGRDDAEQRRCVRRRDHVAHDLQRAGERHARGIVELEDERQRRSARKLRAGAHRSYIRTPIGLVAALVGERHAGGESADDDVDRREDCAAG
jgi:hypothetical protein